ncbi:MAG: leucyl aminopeptidase family protein [Deltaproteobacteria bacterium]|jgi:leucyl aminopeptidase|nr:leucyl aminopeptidase family protein [Deltaproteobacteria bacterium]
MNFKYKSAHMNGPGKPGTAVFLLEGDQTLEGRPEIASFRRCLTPLMAGGVYKGGYLEGASLFLAEEEIWLAVTGLGKASELNEARLVEAGADAATRLGATGLKEAFVALPPLEGLSPAKVMELIATGARLALDRHPGYRSQPPSAPSLATLTLQHLGSKDPVEKPQQSIGRADVLARAQLEARRLSDMPPNMLYPESFAEEAKRVALKHKLRISVWESEKIAFEGAGGLLSVGAGSRRPPLLVILEYPGKSTSLPPTALVGKGVTFDSGGLCLKSGEGMLYMKSDMSGAAIVLATLAAAAELRLPGPLVGVMPLAENMPGGGAYRPGDVVSMLSGQMVEVVNTDAEGRMVLADAIAVAQKFKPARLIDIATLTGACQVALGPLMAGLFANDDGLADEIAAAGRAVGEDFWRLPLYDPYEEEIKSEIADFRQSGSRFGAAINAALFLRRFVKPPLPWAHLDIAGPGRRLKKCPSCPEGASGFGTRTLLKLLMAE